MVTDEKTSTIRHAEIGIIGAGLAALMAARLSGPVSGAPYVFVAVVAHIAGRTLQLGGSFTRRRYEESDIDLEPTARSRDDERA